MQDTMTEDDTVSHGANAEPVTFIVPRKNNHNRYNALFLNEFL